MKTPYFSRSDIKFCQVPIPPIDDNKANQSVDFTADQISKYSQSQTHPSIYYNASGWNGHKWWLATTPYPYSVGVFENPCIYYADDQIDGTPPVEFTPISGTADGIYTVINNPITKVSSNADTNSDPDIIVINDVMYMISRDNADHHNPFMQKSLTGEAWTPRGVTPLWDNVSLGLPELVSPSFLKVDNKILAYCCTGTSGINYINIPDATGISWGIYIMEGTTLENGVDFQYAGKCYISGDKKIQPWHMDICLHDGKYYMVVCATEIGSGTGAMHLFLAESSDGITFYMYSKPLLNAFASYRPSLCVDSSSRLVIYGSTNSATPTSTELGDVTPAPDGRYIIMVADTLSHVISDLKSNEWAN